MSQSKSERVEGEMTVSEWRCVRLEWVWFGCCEVFQCSMQRCRWSEGQLEKAATGDVKAKPRQRRGEKDTASGRDGRRWLMEEEESAEPRRLGRN